MIKKLFCRFVSVLTDFGYAKAAAALAREGKHEAAKQVMLAREEFKC